MYPDATKTFEELSPFLDRTARFFCDEAIRYIKTRQTTITGCDEGTTVLVVAAFLASIATAIAEESAMARVGSGKYKEAVQAMLR